MGPSPGSTTDPAHRIFVPSFHLAIPELQGGERPESFPSLEESGARLVVAMVSVPLHRLVGEMEPVENHRVVLCSVRPSREAREQPPAYLLPEVVECKRIFLLEVRIHRKRIGPVQVIGY